MSIDAGTHLASWGYCKGAADLLAVLAHQSILTGDTVQVLARMWADNMDAALITKGIDAVDRLDVLAPLDPVINGDALL